MATRNLLLTGSTGYIGGTILASLLAETDPWVRTFDISALVRTESQAATIREMGVNPVLFTDFDDTEHLKSIAEDFDVIVHVAVGWHAPSARAFIQGLGTRKKKNDSEVHYLHVSGTTNLSDRPHSAGYVETRTFSDEEDIYSYEKYRQSFEVYIQRTTDIAVIEHGEALGVKTYIVMAPNIFGLGTGPFNRFTMSLPGLFEAAVKRGSGAVLSDGKTVWSRVHVQDLADLYMILLRRVQQGDGTIPQGRKGIYFCESGPVSHLELSEKVATAGRDLGKLKTAEVPTIGLEEAAQEWAHGLISVAELANGSNARTKAVLARKLGWKPQRDAEWETTFHTELREYLKNPPPERDMALIMRQI